MESIHVKEDLKISMNESEIALSKTKLRRKGLIDLRHCKVHN
jgi:hypothetical protein